MNTTVETPPPGLQDLLRTLHGPLLVLAAGLAVLGYAFSTEVAAAYRVWMDSTAYSHCLFVLPIALYLAWERRAGILAEPVVPLRWAGLAALPIGIAWFVAERLGIMEGRQLMAISLVEVLFLSVLGWRMATALAAPLLYLYFLVPFGAFITPLLQDWTAVFTEFGLNVLDIPHETDGYLIDVPGGRFFIAEACAGLRFLIASIAFGVLYACLMYRSPWRRAFFILASIIVPIIANWFRALGIIVLGYVLGSAEAAAADHIIYGWVFFSAVTLLLIAVGLPFRQDGVGRVAVPSAVPVPAAGRLLPVALLVVVISGIGPLVACLIDRAGLAATVPEHFTWITPVGCREGVAEPGLVAGSEQVRFTCPQGVLLVSAQVFSARSTWSAIGHARSRLTNESRAEETTGGRIAVGPGWSYLIANGTPSGSYMTATALWTGGNPAPGGLGGRVLLARQSILGGGSRSILLSVGVQVDRSAIRLDEERQIKALITNFLQVQYTLNHEVSRLSRAGSGSGG